MEDFNRIYHKFVINSINETLLKEKLIKLLLQMSAFLASFLSSNIDELIINCEAILREIENKENEILALIHSFINTNSKEKEVFSEEEKVVFSEEKEGYLVINEKNTEENPLKINKFDSQGLNPKLLFQIKRIFSALQYVFSQFGRVIHYINIANSPLPKASKLAISSNNSNKNGIFLNNINNFFISSEDHGYEDYQDEDFLGEDEKLISEILKTENSKKKLIKMNIPLTFLNYEALNKAFHDENNLISQSKKKKSLEVYFKWKLHKWDNLTIKKNIFGIPCRICLNKVWSNKLAMHSKLCLQRYQISNSMENHKKFIGKFSDMAVENKRNLEIQRTLEK